MRSKLVLAALIFLSILPVAAQVAPTVKISGLPLGVGVGLTDYDTDYYRPFLPSWSGREIGASAWVDYSLFRGLGVEAKGTYISSGGPTPVAGYDYINKDLNEATLKGGLIYKYHRQFLKLRPFVTGEAGVAKINFPSTNYYTNDNYTLYSLGGGVEYRAWNTIFVRANYDWEDWLNFRQGKLNPNGFTIGATYYLRGIHRHL